MGGSRQVGATDRERCPPTWRATRGCDIRRAAAVILLDLVWLIALQRCAPRHPPAPPSSADGPPPRGGLACVVARRRRCHAHQQPRHKEDDRMAPELVVHCKRAAHDVYVGRPSKLGDPLVIGHDWHGQRLTGKRGSRSSPDNNWRTRTATSRGACGRRGLTLRHRAQARLAQRRRRPCGAYRSR